MNQLSQRLNRLSPSATLAMSQKSNELKAQGVNVINMSVGVSKLGQFVFTLKSIFFSFKSSL